jgi:hypothetical protein
VDSPATPPLLLLEHEAIQRHEPHGSRAAGGGELGGRRSVAGWRLAIGMSGMAGWKPIMTHVSAGPAGLRV